MQVAAACPCIRPTGPHVLPPGTPILCPLLVPVASVDAASAAVRRTCANIQYTAVDMEEPLCIIVIGVAKNTWLMPRASGGTRAFAPVLALLCICQKSFSFARQSILEYVILPHQFCSKRSFSMQVAAAPGSTTMCPPSFNLSPTRYRWLIWLKHEKL